MACSPATNAPRNIDRARELLTLPIIPVDAIKAANTNADQPQTPEHRCPCCGGHMIIIERFERGSSPRYQASPYRQRSGSIPRDHVHPIAIPQTPVILCCRSAEHVSGSANSLFMHQFSLNRRFRGSKPITAGPAPCVTPCNLSISRLPLPIDDVARSPPNSP